MQHPPKYPSTPYWPWSPSVDENDEVHPHPSWFVGRPVVITEKLDGGNTCLWNGEVYARSTSTPSHAGWMGMVRKHHAWKTLDVEIDPGMVFYGEDLFGVHSIKYPPLYEDKTFYLFSVRQVGGDNDPVGYDYFYSWPAVEKMAENLGVLTVPIWYQTTFNSVEDITKTLEESMKAGSALGDAPCEGFVIRLVDGFDAVDFPVSVAKYVRSNHVQTDEHWTRNWQTCDLKERSNEAS